ncbi:MAG: helix-turn-helix transcriptional regulator, partial [Pseudomonadota bacterium]
SHGLLGADRFGRPRPSFIMILILYKNSKLYKMRYILEIPFMPGRVELIETQALGARIADLGACIRQRRKALGVSATAAAQAARMSRVTWHRIEAGTPSVSIAAWFNALAVLGLNFHLGEPLQPAHNLPDVVPLRVELAAYPQLMALAWQVTGTDALSPREAHDIYDRNARHIDWDAIDPAERTLIESLRSLFGDDA